MSDVFDRIPSALQVKDVPHRLPVGRSGYRPGMRIVNRIVDAIVVIITAPFRAIAALFGRR